MSTEQLDNAAAAFDKAMGNSSDSSASNDSGSALDNAAPEQLFANLNEHVDHSSDVAGGDDDISPAPKPKVKKPVEQEEAADDEEGDESDPEDEDEEGEDEADPDEDEDDEDGEVYDVIVDGEERQVSLKEALAGYIRTETFHKRVTEVEEGRKAVIIEAQNVIARRNQYIQKLEQAEAILAGVMPTEPDWDKLYAEDPAGARKLQKDYDAYKASIQKISEARTQAVKDAEEEDRQTETDFAGKEFNKFIAANPKIRNRADLDKELGSMRRTALTVGFSEDELSRVYDSRMLRILQKASKYDRIMSSKPRPVKQGQKAIVKSSAGNNRTARKDFDRANKRLTQTGSIDDATSVFQKILQKG